MLSVMAKYSNILVGTDGSPTATHAVSTAVDLASAFGARLHVVSSAPITNSAYLGPELVGIGDAVARCDAAQREQAWATLEAARAEGARRGIETDVHQCQGDAAEAICRVAETVRADLVVVGNRGMTGARRFLGSVPNKVSHHAPCSVLIVDTASS